jgi:hypothetical protein
LRSNVSSRWHSAQRRRTGHHCEHQYGPGGSRVYNHHGKDRKEPADAVLLSHTHIVTGVSNAANPTVVPGNIVMTAQRVELANGTAVRADTTGGAQMPVRSR